MIRGQVHLRRGDVLDFDLCRLCALHCGLRHASGRALLLGLRHRSGRALLQGGHADAGLFAADAEEPRLAGGEDLYFDLLALEA